VIIENTISGNQATYGGGICSDRSSHLILRNLIQQNEADSGGGMYCYSSYPSFFGNRITGNVAGVGGGVACSDSSKLWMTNNTISGNVAGEAGGAIYCGLSSTSRLVNTIMWENSAAVGDEICLEGTSSLIIEYSDVRYGQDSIYVEQGSVLDWGSGMIDSDPLFRDTAGGNFHLMADYCGDPSNSPCIDVGHPDSLDIVLDCLLGLGTESCDLGAFGGTNEGIPVGIIDEGQDKQSLPRAITLSQNYPNPFNPTTTIRFEIPGISGHVTWVRLAVYDIRGKLIKILLESELESGCHRITWDGSNKTGGAVASGVYLYTLTLGKAVTTKKMVIIR